MVKKYDLYDIVRYTKSYTEDEVFDFIKSVDSGIKIIRNDRSVIYPKELDLYIPEYHLGIECNPTYTHNSSLGSFDDDPKPYKYHQDKSIRCLESGNYLLHIFGYQWSNKKDIVKSKILELINKSKMININDCNIQFVDNKEAEKFIRQNSFYHFTSSFKNVGIFLQSELVALVCFNNTKRLPSKYAQIDDIYCIKTCVNKLNYEVDNLLGKAIEYFITCVKCNLLLAYSDFAFDGIYRYRESGFSIDNISNPKFKLVRMKDDSVIRLKSNKDANYKDIVRVYDSGQLRWVKCF